MADYTNPLTPLTGSRYAYSATLTCGPPRHGANPSKDRSGVYVPPPGATVGTLREAIQSRHAQECGIAPGDCVFVRFTLREQ